jgi:hypothetical protein
MTDWQTRLETDGFALLPAVFNANEISAAIAEWNVVCEQNVNDPAILANDGPAYGARNLLQLWPRVMELARRPRLAEPLRELLGRKAGVVRALFFDKPPGHTWALPWHKDYSIAVREHLGGDIFTKPTTKAGVPHVMASPELLHAMVTARIHLDAVTAENGPLRVIPGSHRHFEMGRDDPREPVAICCEAGDVLLMRPLLTHSSGHSKTEANLHRRIVHLECAPSPELPGGYCWHSFQALGDSSC